MPDKLLICQNCKNSFVYSEFEQKIDSRNTHTDDTSPSAPSTNNPAPIYCLICASTKASEAKHPSKPQKNPPTKQVRG